MAEKIQIEVAFALPHKQKIIALEVDSSSTVKQAVEASGIVALFDDIDIDSAKLGVFGKAVKPDSYQLKVGDRIEIYRPLIADPKEARKKRAAKAAGDDQ